MKSTSRYCLALASLVIVSLSPCQAQTSTDGTTTTSTTTTSVTTPATTKTKKHHFSFRRRRATKAKKYKVKKHRMSGKQLSGGVSRKGKGHTAKTYKPLSSAQDKRLDKLNSTLADPKAFKKMPELNSPTGSNSSQSAPGI